MKFRSKLLIIVGALGVAGAAVAGALYLAFPVQMSTIGGMSRNYLISLTAPAGTITTELNAAYKATAAIASPPAAEAPSSNATAGDWPSYNKTLTSERYSQLSQINTKNVGKLKVLCTYDTEQYACFESGLIMVNNALIGTTELDIFSLDPTNCHENWRTHEDYPPSLLPCQPRRRLHGRPAVSRHSGRAGAGLRLQDRQASLGNDDRGPETRRVDPSAPIA